MKEVSPDVPSWLYLAGLVFVIILWLVALQQLCLSYVEDFPKVKYRFLTVCYATTELVLQSLLTAHYLNSSSHSLTIGLRIQMAVALAIGQVAAYIFSSRSIEALFRDRTREKAPPQWFRSTWKIAFMIHSAIFGLCYLTAFALPYKSSFPIYIYDLFLNVHVVVGTALIIYVVYRVREQVHKAYIKGSINLKQQHTNNDPISTPVSGDSSPNKSNMAVELAMGIVKNRSDGDKSGGGGTGGDHNTLGSPTKQRSQPTSNTAHTILSIQQLLKARTKLDLINLALLVSALSGVYGFTDQILSINEALHDSLYSSPYPTPLSFIVHEIFIGIYISVLIAWAYSKGICDGEEGSMEYSVCKVCCPCCVIKRKKKKVMEVILPQSLKLGQEDEKDKHFLTVDNGFIIVKSSSNPNANTNANTNVNINATPNTPKNMTSDKPVAITIATEKEESSDSGGVAHTKTRDNSEYDTALHGPTEPNEDIKIEDIKKPKMNLFTFGKALAVPTARKRNSITETPTLMVEQASNKKNIRIVIYFWENVFQITSDLISEKSLYEIKKYDEETIAKGMGGHSRIEMIRDHFKIVGGKYFQNKNEDQDNENELSGVIPFILCNETCDIVMELFKKLQIDVYFEKDIEPLLKNISNYSNRDDRVIKNNQKEEKDKSWLKKPRILGWDHSIRRESSATLNAILLKIINICQCRHEDLLYVDCHEAIVSHISKINLCKTYKIKEKGCVTQQELDDITKLFYHVL